MPGRPWGFWATVGLAIVILIAYVMAQEGTVFVWFLASRAAHHRALPTDASSNGLLLASATCVSMPVVVGLAYLFARIRTGPRAALYLGFRPIQGKMLVRWSIALAVLVFLSDSLTAVLGRPIVPQFMVEIYETAGFLPLLWLALMIAAPLAEETLFRGFLFEGILHSKLGAAGAVILSSMMWASIHIQYDAYGVASIFVEGLFLGYVRLRTQSLYATMFLHGLGNLIATVEAALKVKGYF